MLGSPQAPQSIDLAASEDCDPAVAAHLDELIGRMLDVGLFHRAFAVARQYKHKVVDLELVQAALQLAEVRMPYCGGERP